MPSLEYFFVAESYAVDSNTGHVSAFNIVNQIAVDEFPIVVPRLVALSCWLNTEEEFDSEEFHVVVEVQVPGEENKREFRASFSPDTRVYQIVTDLRNAEFTTEGDVKFRVSINGEHKATHTIVVAKNTDDPWSRIEKR